MGKTQLMQQREPGHRFQHSDEELWSAALNGDQSGFEQLYRRHEAAAQRIAARICGPGAAEDAVQAAFLSVWRSRATFDPSLGTVRSWILAVVRNRAIDSLRERKRTSSHVTQEHLPEQPDGRLTETEVLARETGAAVREAVAHLPPAQREVIELAYFREYSHSEIASALQVPLGTVKGRTRLAFEKLPDRLTAYRRGVLSGASAESVRTQVLA
jgi:RNA polymerase sigma-70 factor (ECF subfamily)